MTEMGLVKWFLGMHAIKKKEGRHVTQYNAY